MNQDQLIKEICINTGVSALKVEDVLDELTKIIFINLKIGGHVTIDRLGRFDIGERKARITMNGDFRAAKITPRFYPSRALRGYLNEDEFEELF